MKFNNFGDDYLYNSETDKSSLLTPVPPCSNIDNIEKESNKQLLLKIEQYQNIKEELQQANNEIKKLNAELEMFKKKHKHDKLFKYVEIIISAIISAVIATLGNIYIPPII